MIDLFEFFEGGYPITTFANYGICKWKAVLDNLRLYDLDLSFFFSPVEKSQALDQARKTIQFGAPSRW